MFEIQFILYPQQLRWSDRSVQCQHLPLINRPHSVSLFLPPTVPVPLGPKNLYVHCTAVNSYLIGHCFYWHIFPADDPRIWDFANRNWNRRAECCYMVLIYPRCCYMVLTYPGCCYTVLTYPECCYTVLTYPECCYKVLTYPECCYTILTYPECCYMVLTYPEYRYTILTYPECC